MKETALPALLYGFDNETQRLLREVEDIKQRKEVRNFNYRTKLLIKFQYDEEEGCAKLMSVTR